MERAIVIGCPGSGKSTFSRALRDKTGLPLYYMDCIWHREDRTTITKEELAERVKEIVSLPKWIIDGNYTSTMELRLRRCDTVFFLDLPLETCLAGAEARVGQWHEDLPWLEKDFDPAFRQWIIEYPEKRLPRVRELVERYAADKQVVVFRTRQEMKEYIDRF